MCGFYSLVGSILEKCGIFLKNCRFSRPIRPDWGNTARAGMAGLGSIGLRIFGSNVSLLALLQNAPIECP